jgi:putative aldouronate transport system substrate-binding protein
MKMLKNIWNRNRPKSPAGLRIGLGMGAGLLAAFLSCGQAKAPEGETASKEPYEIVATYMTFLGTPRDLPLVEEEINKITVPAINARLSLFPLTFFEAASKTNLMISSGEKLDLMMVLFQGGPVNYVNNGQIIELDELFVKYGEDIARAEGIAMAGGYMDNILYAIPSEEKFARQNGILMRGDLLAKYSFAKNEWDMVNYEDLDTLFARVRAGEGENLYMFPLSGSPFTTFTNFHTVDVLGTGLASGGLMNGGLDNTTVVNVFTTPEYKKHLEWFRKWYLAGYWPRDCVTMTDVLMDLMRGGRYFAALNATEADMKAKFMQDSGLDVRAFNTVKPYAMTSIYQISVWTIPITCEDPETTFKFLNLMYKSEEINNLLHNGIEGLHYVKTGDWGIIDFPEGLNAETSGYYNPLGLWGDKSIRYQWPPITAGYFEELKTFNASVDNTMASKALGYCFNSYPVRTEYAAVNDVISQYQAGLETGSLDPETALPQFLAALNAAGIDKVIAENQKQLDTWLGRQ